MVKIIDRRKQAMGGQARNRKESAITHIAWHYTAVARKLKRTIENHERYWKNSLGWNRGGYHFYIDADGKIYQNYDLTTISNGVGGNNGYTVHISVEANSASDYSQAQIDARHELTLYLMDRLNIPASKVMQHKEYPGASTSCAGYTKSQMNEFRRKLTGGKVVKPQTSKPSPTKPQTTGGSVVNYMNSKGMDSSYNNRAKLARQYGIKNYKGTASQNIELLNKLKAGKPSKPKKSISQMATEIIEGKHGSGHANRRASLGISQSEYNKVRAEVNRRAGVKSKPKQSVNQMANKILASKGVPNGHEARRKWLGVDNATYQKVRAEVNRRLK